MTTTDRTPEWRPHMGAVRGMAAHPSTQRLTTDELHAQLERRRIEYQRDREAFGWSRDHDQDVNELLENDETGIAAIELAIAWREGHDS